MSSNAKVAKGSIIAKILIVAMAVLLIFTLTIPTNIWDAETREEEECHFRLKSLTEAQNLFRKANDVYADTLANLLTLANADPLFRAAVDSTATIVSDKDTLAQVIEGRLTRLFSTVPVSIDSFFNCPSTGSPYAIEVGEEGRYTIKCTTEEHSVTLYNFFTREYVNHGEVNQSQDVSW